MVFDENEWDEIAQFARTGGMTVSEWVRHSLRPARREKATGSVAWKLGALRAAVQFEGPTGDIDQVLAEIASGYPRNLPD